jgi:hypothetical protein
MFAAAYFAPRYFARRYFPPALATLVTIIDRTDAPLGYTGEARRWLRRNGAYATIREALEALEQGNQPKAAKKARKAMRAVAQSPELYLRHIARELTTQDETPDITALRQVLAMIEAFRVKDRQKEDALLALLLAI